MTDLILRQDVTKLIDGWMEAERNGEQFPVDFDLAWPIAGYARKDTAKRAMLNFLLEGEDYLFHTLRKSNGGRTSEEFRLSCDAFKELCMLSKSPQGKATRQYFIQAEKKWQLVQQHAPQFAQEVELMHLKIELAKQEAIKAQADEKVLALRHYVTTALPEPVQQKILGYKEVTTIEYRDRVIHNDDVVNDGSTVTKTELCHRYGILTRQSKPDFKRLNQILEKLPDDAFLPAVTFHEATQLKRDWLDRLDRMILKSDRNLYLGE
jgi:phage anti-repressor protein